MVGVTSEIVSLASIGGIAQWQSIRLQIERSPVQIRLPPLTVLVECCFAVPKVYPPIYDVPATTECLLAESGSLTQVSRVGFLASPSHSSSCIIQC